MTAAPILHVELKPHRSLTPRGFLILMGAVIFINMLAGIGFWLAGAWPVIGFCGLEVALLYLAFRYSYAQARARQILLLHENRLEIHTITARGAASRAEFQPYWLRVDCDPDDEQHPLFLRSHGRTMKVGEFLAPEQRWQLAEHLRAALHQLRQPAGAGLRDLDLA